MFMFLSASFQVKISLFLGPKYFSFEFELSSVQSISCFNYSLQGNQTERLNY